MLTVPERADLILYFSARSFNCTGVLIGGELTIITWLLLFPRSLLAL